MDEGGRTTFNGDCCPSMVTMKAQWSSHVAGAEGITHRAISEQHIENKREHAEILVALNGVKQEQAAVEERMMARFEEFKADINEQIRKLSRQQWYASGVVAGIVFLLMFLGPERIKNIFAVVEMVLTGGWNG